jgi:hypothetical protein
MLIPTVKAKTETENKMAFPGKSREKFRFCEIFHIKFKIMV